MNRSTQLTHLKDIAEFCRGLTYDVDWREVVEHILEQEQDFTVDETRFIADDAIFEAMCDHISSDEHVLGGFDKHILENVTELPLELIEIIQENEGYSALGKFIAGNQGYIVGLAQEVIRLDGYGHTFNAYDGTCVETTLAGTKYHVFNGN